MTHMEECPGREMEPVDKVEEDVSGDRVGYFRFADFPEVAHPAAAPRPAWKDLATRALVEAAARIRDDHGARGRRSSNVRAIRSAGRRDPASEVWENEGGATRAR